MKTNKLHFGVVVCVLMLFGLMQNASAQTFNIGVLSEGSTSNARDNIAHFVSEHPGYSWEDLNSNAAFNAMTVPQLVAAYDILVVPWQIVSTADLDWTTRILAYISAGGGVLWEDPTNVGDGDLSASGISLVTGSSSYPGIGGGDITLVPPFDSNGAIGWYHIHFGITGHDGTWFPWSTDKNGGVHGVAGEFGAGRMLVGVSDNLYHPDMGDADPSADEVGAYNLLINQIFWLGSGDVDVDVTQGRIESIPVPTLSQWGFIVFFVLLGLLGVMRLRSTRS